MKEGGKTEMRETTEIIRTGKVVTTTGTERVAITTGTEKAATPTGTGTRTAHPGNRALKEQSLRKAPGRLL